MRHLLLPLLLAFPAAALPPLDVLPSPLRRDPMEVSVHRLDNGLTVLLSPSRHEPRAEGWVVVRAGAKDDPGDSTGMAHYLEHMVLFKGNSQLGTLDWAQEKPRLDRISALYEELFRTADAAGRQRILKAIDAENVAAGTHAVPQEFMRMLEALGFQGINAWTSHEATAYHMSFPANRADVWAKVVSEQFRGPVFRLFQTELEAVYEEKNRALDNPGRILSEALNERLFPGHPYGRSVLGTVEHLKNPSLAQMYAFFETRYRPRNMAVVVAGDFDREKMLELVARTFGTLKSPPLPEREERPAAQLPGPVKVEVRYQAEEQVIVAWRTAPELHEDREALDVMDMVMDNSQAGLLNLRLNQAQRVKYSGSGPRVYNDDGAWVVWGTPKKDQTLEETEALLMETVEALKRGEFEEEDVAAVVTDFEVAEKQRLETNSGRAGAMADAFLSGEQWAHRVDRLKRLGAVRKADVVRVAGKYLGEARVVAYRRQGDPERPSITKPSFTPIPIDPAKKSAYAKQIEAMPAEPIEPAFLEEGEDYQRVKADWGTLVATKNPMNDVFGLFLEFDRGWRHERGLCEAFDLLELSGAGDLDAAALQKRLYRLGTSMDFFCSEQTSGVSIKGLERNLEESVQLMFQRFEAPKVATDTLKKMVDVAIGAHRDNKKNPGSIQRALAEYAQRGKESAVLGDLTDAELLALEEPKLLDLARRTLDYKRKGGYIGTERPKKVARLLARGSAAKDPPARTPYRYLRPERPRVLLAHREMVQANLGLAAPDAVFDPSLWVDIQVYNQVLDPIIFEEVRESRALAYAAGGRYALGPRLGDENRLTGGAGCQADKAVETAALLLKLLQEPPVTPERFSEAVKAIEQDYRTDRISFRGIPTAVITWKERGSDGDPRPERFKRTLAYRPEDLGRFSERFRGKPVTFYILGDRTRVDVKGLAALGEVEEVPIDALFPY